MVLKVLKKLLKDYWLQLVLSALWGGYRLSIAETSENQFATFVTHFSGALFILSWMFNQFMRVKKQLVIQEEFGNVKLKLSKLLKKLEKQTDDLIGYSTGGDSIAYFTPSIPKKLTLNLDLINTSEYPVFDVVGDWIDLDEEIDPENKIFWTRHPINLGYIYPSKILMGVLSFNIRERNQLRINIFLRTRNRNITQAFRVIKEGEDLKIAYKTNSKDFEEVHIPDDFPGYDKDNPDDVF